MWNVPTTLKIPWACVSVCVCNVGVVKIVGCMLWALSAHSTSEVSFCLSRRGAIFNPTWGCVTPYFLCLRGGGTQAWETPLRHPPPPQSWATRQKKSCAGSPHVEKKSSTESTIVRGGGGVLNLQFYMTIAFKLNRTKKKKFTINLKSPSILKRNPLKMFSISFGDTLSPLGIVPFYIRNPFKIHLEQKKSSPKYWTHL